jgi:TonB family protein
VVRGANPGSTDTRPEAEVQDAMQRASVNPQLEAPVVVTHVRPEYPARLHDAGVQGIVTLQGVISTDGRITQITAVTPTQPELEDVARAAVSRWRYVPTHLHGVPVDTHITVVIEFQL